MPYILRTYSNGQQLSQTGAAPQPTGNFEEFSQAGWAPVAQALNLTVNSVYRLDDPMPGGISRKIRLVAVGAGQNAITYVREGVA
ncbi:hypothetical protein [Novispirillum itersonii]|uniref:hypothetical protein n=1 Tax=Novispirillum itersonii TaxID=189 RepID=UPI0003631EFF|nr:hypothetical protein [Novispirillum itersonii]